MKRRIFFSVLILIGMGLLVQTTGVVMAEPKPEAVSLVLAGGAPGGGLALQLEAIAKACGIEVE